MDSMTFCLQFTKLIHENKSYQQIADALGMTYGAVYGRAYLYRNKLGINLPHPTAMPTRAPVNVKAINHALRGL